MTGMRVFFLFCAALAQDFTHCSSDSEQQLTQKDKVLWKGESQGSRQEQGLSAPSVTLVSLQIGFVLVNEGEGEKEKRHTSKKERERKRCCFGSCLDSWCARPCVRQVTLVVT